MRVLTDEKDELFDQLQMRQAELESSQTHLEALQSQGAELQHQLREASERAGLLAEELLEAQNEHALRGLGGGGGARGVSDADVSRMVGAAEARYEARLGELRRTLGAVEREREEGEAEWSRKLMEKAREVERLKSVLSREARSHLHFVSDLLDPYFDRITMLFAYLILEIGVLQEITQRVHFLYTLDRAEFLQHSICSALLSLQLLERL